LFVYGYRTPTVATLQDFINFLDFKMQVLLKSQPHCATHRTAGRQMMPMHHGIKTLAPQKQLMPFISRQSQLAAGKGFGVPLPKQQKQDQKGAAPIVQDPCPCSSGKAYKVPISIQIYFNVL